MADKSSQKQNTDDEKSKNDKKQGRLAKFRERHLWVDRFFRMQEHYSRSRGNQAAGAVTYFGFLSLFPLLALTFAVVGFVVRWYPAAQDQVTDALNSYLPGLVGSAQEGK